MPDTRDIIIIIIGIIAVLALLGSLNLSIEDIQDNINITEEKIFIQVCYHNHTATPLTFGEAGKYYNLTFDDKHTIKNGFSFDGNNTITAESTGRYLTNFMAMGDGQNNHKYLLTLTINGIIQNCTEIHKKMAAGGDITTMTGTGIIRLEEGDNINLVITDETGTGIGNYYGSNLNLLKIDE